MRRSQVLRLYRLLPVCLIVTVITRWAVYEHEHKGWEQMEKWWPTDPSALPRVADMPWDQVRAGGGGRFRSSISRECEPGSERQGAS